MLSPAEATSQIRAHVQQLPAEQRPLHAAVGGVLRATVHATRDQPPFDRVTMDGIAFASAVFAQGQRRFRVCGTQAAGAPPITLPERDGCIEVMTGAIIPEGCDCVVPVEQITTSDGYAQISGDIAVTSGLNVHRRGLDCAAGQRLLESGTRLGPAEIAVLASNGVTNVPVSRDPRIAVISTGDELVEPGEQPAGWQIYRSNAYAIVAALKRRGYAHIASDHVKDDLESLTQQLGKHLRENDVLILSGGVSMGRFDYVPRVLDELGVRRIFHKISQRPGKPMWFGIGPSGQAVYALPGNPVSTLMCLARYVYEGLDVMRGISDTTTATTVVMDSNFEVKPSLTFFLPVALGGHARAKPRPTQGSGDFTSLLGTDGFVELPPGPALVQEGTPVPFYSW